MILPGAPRLSQKNWSLGQGIDLKAIWDDVARAIGVNAALSIPLRGTLSPDQKPNLSTGDAGFLFYSTDYQHTYRWSGTAWEYAPGDEGSGYFALWGEAPTNGRWQLCDGSGSITRSKADGTLALVVFSGLAAGVMPNLITTPSVFRNNTACTGLVTAVLTGAGAIPILDVLPYFRL